MRRIIDAVAAACLAFCLCQGVAHAQITLPEGPGRDLVYGKCRTCHDLQYVRDSAGIGRGAWNAVLDNMRQFGVRLSDEQRAGILDYLSIYLGPNPPPEKAAAAAFADSIDGEAVFNDQCSSCHQPDGKGQRGQYPPLAGNPDLFRDSLFPALVLLNGLEGRIEVDGVAYDAVMPPFDHLSDGAIAAVIGYVRSAWGNAGARPDGLKPLDARAVAAAREKEMAPEEVHAYRAKLK